MTFRLPYSFAFLGRETALQQGNMEKVIQLVRIAAAHIFDVWAQGMPVECGLLCCGLYRATRGCHRIGIISGLKRSTFYDRYGCFSSGGVFVIDMFPLKVKQCVSIGWEYCPIGVLTDYLLGWNQWGVVFWLGCMHNDLELCLYFQICGFLVFDTVCFAVLCCLETLTCEFKPRVPLNLCLEKTIQETKLHFQWHNVPSVRLLARNDPTFE